MMKQFAVAIFVCVVSWTLGEVAPAMAQAADPGPTAPGAAEAGDTAATDAEPGLEEQELTSTQVFWEKVKSGGWTMVFLVALSVLGLAVVLERAVRLRRDVIVPDGLSDEADRLWREGKYQSLEMLCRQQPSTLGRIVQSVLEHRKGSVSDVSTIAGDIASREMHIHLQKAYPLAVVATLSPLLGLFGTVLGMIESFDVVAQVGSLGDASMLADGISKALVTTATGLVIAVPALFFYHYFRSRITTYGIVLEEQVSNLLSNWFMTKAALTDEGAAAAETSAGVATGQPGAAVGTTSTGEKPAGKEAGHED